MNKTANPSFRIVPGFRIGHLTVEAETIGRKNGYIIWKCRCDCGKELLLDTRSLHRGAVTDCGCITPVKPGQKDLTGLRFGRLTCIKPTRHRNYDGCLIWACQCDCGKLCEVPTAQLTQGSKRSCGCLSHPPLKDFPGKRFGSLTVISYAGKQAGLHHWNCRCDCGNETAVGQSLLQSGKTKSCGCLQTRKLIKQLKLHSGTSVMRLESTKKHRISSNTSGHTGVYWQKKSRKWISQITFRGKTYYLGSFDNIEDAVQARKAGESMHNDFLTWYYQTYGKDSQ